MDLLSKHVLRALQPAAIILTGDLVEGKNRQGTGQQHAEEWQMLDRFLSRISEDSGLPLERILSVRGNHDTFNTPVRGGPGDFYSALRGDKFGTFVFFFCTIRYFVRVIVSLCLCDVQLHRMKTFWTFCMFAITPWTKNDRVGPSADRLSSLQAHLGRGLGSLVGARGECHRGRRNPARLRLDPQHRSVLSGFSIICVKFQ